MKNEQKNDKKNYFQTRFGKFRTLTRIMRQKKVSYDFLKRNPQKTFSPCGTVEIKKIAKPKLQNLPSQRHYSLVHSWSQRLHAFPTVPDSRVGEG